MLDETAIAELIVKQDHASSDVVTADNVRQALIDLATGQKFLTAEWCGDIRDEKWLATIDAAKIIAAVCQSLSEHRATFNKKEDSLFLLQSIMRREPEQLQSLANYVRNLVNKVTTTET